MTTTKTSPKSRKRAPLTSHAEVTEMLVTGVEGIGNDEGWKGFLRAQRTLHHYSPLNRFWFHLQGLQRGIDTSMVASYGNWRRVGRQVQKGERALAALAPVFVRKTDEATGETRPVLIGFKIIHMSFGLSQTDGQPVTPPEPIALTGDHDGWDDLKAYAESLGCTVARAGKDRLGSANGSTSPDLSILIRDDLSVAQSVKTLIHEIAHVVAGHVEAGIAEYQRHRGTMEVQAESIAFVVADALGLDTSSYSFAYVAGWATETRNAEKPGVEVKASIPVILKAADAILAGLGFADADPVDTAVAAAEANEAAVTEEVAA